MGSQKMQGELWGKRAADWASIQERTGIDGYMHALNFLNISASDLLLDVGCGSGFFSRLAVEKGATVTGIDASDLLIAYAQVHHPSIQYLTGEMEELPFDDGVFDVVTGFNSFQYAAHTANALSEARRVLKDNGRLVVMIWGNRVDCETATYLKVVGGLLPPPPPGAPGPFALSENGLLEQVLMEVGFRILDNTDVASVWDYPDVETALRGLMSSGPVVRAIDYCGIDKVREAVLDAVQPYVQENGHVVYNNKFRVVIAQK